uniref:Uncharacterized protein n=1 Tax=Triticum urartu TaxID=4572 RepID=A0A8R7U1M0_TRIUA
MRAPATDRPLVPADHTTAPLLDLSTRSPSGVSSAAAPSRTGLPRLADQTTCGTPAVTNVMPAPLLQYTTATPRRNSVHGAAGPLPRG